jgi:16S rRNA (cytidine1402-2'-O)-methyltransferase
MQMSKGHLYLIPTFLAETEKEKVFPDYNIEIMLSLYEFIVEDLRTARRFLRKIGFKKDFDKVKLHLLNEHTDLNHIDSFLNSINKGINIGLLSEAGLPCVADPGAELVKIAQRKNITVIPLIGPSSLMLALMASGFNGQNFAFLGYLPIDEKARVKKLKEIEATIYSQNQTQIFIETPYRNIKLFDSIIKYCSPSTMLSIGINLTGKNSKNISKSVKEWKKQKPDFHKIPAVFLLYK